MIPVVIPVEGNLCRVKNVTGAEEGPTGNRHDLERFL
jgi:hypothetical protein